MPQEVLAFCYLEVQEAWFCFWPLAHLRRVVDSTSLQCFQLLFWALVETTLDQHPVVQWPHLGMTNAAVSGLEDLSSLEHKSQPSFIQITVLEFQAFKAPPKQNN